VAIFPPEIKNIILVEQKIAHPFICLITQDQMVLLLGFSFLSRMPMYVSFYCPNLFQKHFLRDSG
jgi:hypothetical protein